MSKLKVLYVEDEPNLAGIVKDTLETRGYEVRHVSDGAQVLSECADLGPDICLLDVMLPNVDGFTLGKELARDHPELPILYLTAKDSTADVLTGFQCGGNDYLKKPFSLEELMVRMQNLIDLRSGATNSNGKPVPIQIGQYTFDPADHTLSFEGSTRQLSYREVELLQYCCPRMNDIIVKKDLLLAVWGDDSYYNARNLDVYMKKLRSHLSKDPNIRILTLRGVGYRFSVN